MSMDQPIIILGMHRSGTSCLAGALKELGVHLGTVSTYNSFNPKGNQEHMRIRSLHDSVLDDAGYAWHSPPPDRVPWSAVRIAEQESIIQELSIETPWGFKCPRTLLLIDRWLAQFPKARLVASFRHPALVACSLQSRNSDFSVERGIALWIAYNTRLLRLTQSRTVGLLEFSSDQAVYRRSFESMTSALGLSLTSAVVPFYEPRMENQSNSSSNDVTIPDKALALYETLRAEGRASLP